MKRIKESERESNFMKYVFPEPNTGCWIWGGGLASNGYGAASPLPGITSGRAHRIAYRLFKGEFDNKMQICHTCDVRLCVNPDHLFVGTGVDNMQDMVSKGRSAKGEKIRASHLNKSDIIKIRERYKNGDCTYIELGKEYAVSRITIGYIVRRVTWRHI